MAARRLWVLLLLVLLAGCGGGPAAGTTSSPAPSAPSTPAPSPSPSQARIVRTEEVGDRQVDLTIASPAVGGEVPVRLLLPEGFERGRTSALPVLYLLHGCCDDYVSWTRSTDVEELTDDADLLVVMPDGGRVGFYSDWKTGPAWERFHLTELPALLAQEYGAGERMAIAGVSMGGLGAIGYAARHPGRFRAVGSFSGIVHTTITPDTPQNYLGLVSSQSSNGENGYELWGDPETDAATWREHNPYDLVDRLKGTPLYVSCGDGQSGPLDEEGAVDSIERPLRLQNEALAKKIKEFPDATVDLYEPGTHNWVYWERELHRSWPMFRKALGL